MPKQSAQALARSVDVLVALAILLLMGPLLACVALMLWLEGPGPVLVGQGRLRFRTVLMDADRNVVGRSTLCRFLYLSRLDDAPQFLSLLKGDLSLLGDAAPALSLGA